MGKKSGGGGGDATAGAMVEGQFGIDAARNATYADRVNQTNALGGSNWSNYTTIDPSTGEKVTAWRNDQTLDPTLQRVFDAETNSDARLSEQANQMSEGVGNAFSTPINWDQFGEQAAGPTATNVNSNAYSTDPNARQTTNNVSVNPDTNARNTSSGTRQDSQAFRTDTGNTAATAGDIGANVAATTGDSKFNWDSANRGRAEDASYGRASKRLDNRFEKEQATMERQLSERGLRVGDSAYDTAVENFNLGKNDAYEMAQMGAVGEGRAEDQQSFGQASSAFGTNRGVEQQRFDQNIGVGVNNRSADAQSYGQRDNASSQAFDRGLNANNQNFNQDAQATNDQFNRDLGANNQNYNQQLTGSDQSFNQRNTASNTNFGQNMDSDAQNFQQRSDSNSDNFNRDLNANSQNFNQSGAAADRSNALRSQQIEEYIGKRNLPLQEQNALRQSLNTGNTINSFGGG